MRDWDEFVRRRLPPLGLRPEREWEIREELARQLEDCHDRAIASGCGEEAAIQAAEAQVPSWERLAADILKGERHVMETRAMHRLEALGNVGRDVAHLFRAMRREPLSYGAVVLILASTICLSTVICSAVYAILLRPFPFRHFDRVVRVFDKTPAGQDFAVAPANFLTWKESASSFDDFAAFQATQYTLGDTDAPERVQGARVSASFFPLLGLDPALGRGFRAGEDQPGGPQVAILSHSLWLRRYDGRREIVGDSIRIDGAPVTVIGILPDTFEFPAARSEFSRDPVDLLMPLRIDAQTWAMRDNHLLQVLGRLKPGVTLEQARIAMNALAGRMAEQHVENRRWGANVSPLTASMFGRTERMMRLLLAAIALVVLIGCANVANLLLARGIGRQREFAVRLSLGCSAGRLVRQVLTESITLGMMGGAIGILLGWQGLGVLVKLAPRDLPRIESVHMNGGVLLFTLGLCAGTALLFGIAPALQAIRTRPADAMRSGSKGTTGAGVLRLERPLVVLEVALAVVLVIGAGLLVKSLVLLQGVDPGFEAKGILTFRLRTSTAQYREEAARIEFFEAVLKRMRSMPGVQAASSVQAAPLVWGDSLTGFHIAGRPQAEPGRGLTALWYSIASDYFRTLRIPLRAGRDFGDADSTDAPKVMIINETLAQRHFGKQNPLGQRIFTGGYKIPAEVVGVVGDTRHYGLDDAPREQIYLPERQNSARARTYLLQASVPPESLVPAVTRAVRAIDPEMPVSNAISLENAIRSGTARQRTSAALFTAFAILALALAAAGTYAVMACFVRRRVPELGLRMALGADARQVAGFILGRGLRPAVLGLGIGLGTAAMAARYLEGLLYEVRPLDAATFVQGGGVVLAAAVIACAVPAWIARRIDPMSALRDE